MSADFPAAHSMDTDWFAVDAYGRVGVFLSHEAGAMPLAFRDSAYGQILNWYYIQVLKSHPMALSNPTVKSWLAQPSPLLLKGKPATWDQLPPKISYAVIRATPGGGGGGRHFINLPDGVFSELLFVTSAELRKGFDEGNYTHVWAETMLLNLFGLFTFEHGEQWENWISGPYERHAPPVLPLKVSDLPAELRLSAPIELPANDFLTDEVIQPVDSLPCASWQHAYVAVDRKTIRPMPPGDSLSYNAEEIKALQARGLIIGAAIEPDKE